MARQTDESKLIAIKKATMEIVAERGTSGASISEIAKRSGVSDGYLYRFYKGKRELLEALFEERVQLNYDILFKHMNENDKVSDLIYAYVNHLFGRAKEDTLSMCFYHKLLNDFSFEIPIKYKIEIQNLCDRIVKSGKRHGEIRESITSEQFFSIVIGGTLQYITFRSRGIFSNEAFTGSEVQGTIETILHALK